MPVVELEIRPYALSEDPQAFVFFFVVEVAAVFFAPALVAGRVVSW